MTKRITQKDNKDFAKFIETIHVSKLRELKIYIADLLFDLVKK